MDYRALQVSISTLKTIFSPASLTFSWFSWHTEITSLFLQNVLYRIFKEQCTQPWDWILNSAENSWKLLLTSSCFSQQTVSKSKMRFVPRKSRVKICPRRQMWSSGWSPIPKKKEEGGKGDVEKKKKKKALFWMGTKNKSWNVAMEKYLDSEMGNKVTESG